MFLLSEKLICHPFTSNPDVLSYENLVKRMLPASRPTLPALDIIYLSTLLFWIRLDIYNPCYDCVSSEACRAPGPGPASTPSPTTPTPPWRARPSTPARSRCEERRESLWPKIHPVSSYWIVLFIQLPARIMIITLWLLRNTDTAPGLLRSRLPSMK